MQVPATRPSHRCHRLIAGVTILSLAASLMAGCRRPSSAKDGGASTVASPLLVPSAVTIVPGLHLLGGLSPSAAYVVETSEGLVLIDSGLASDAGLAKSQMSELGLDWKRVRAILLTHVHGDHTGGAEHLRAATGAKVYAGRGDAPILRAGAPREAFFSTFHMPDDNPHPTTVEVELDGGEAIMVGDVRLRAIATPGHTPGSVCYLIERGPSRALFAGDVIMMLRGDEPPHSELRKPLGTYSAFLAPKYRGDAATFLASLRQLRAMPVPELVLPGHPCADLDPQSPAFSQGRWEALLDRGIRDLEQVLARYEKDGADFLDGLPKRILPDLYYLGDFRDAAVYGLFASSQFFVVDAPGGPGLFDFLNARLRQLGLKPTPPAAVLLTSCGAEATAGLGDLIEKCRPRVVAHPEGLRLIREACPAGTTVLSADDLPKMGWFDVVPVPLSGRGQAPIAYRLRWAGKTVLFSGRIPIKVNHDAGVALFSDFLESRGDVQDYLNALDRLRDPAPDVWLPAIPSDGQNANLYDDQWAQTLKDNRSIILREPFIRVSSGGRGSGEPSPDRGASGSQGRPGR
jgi:glyoxylase-like metal-dependent hydrolase (beta-lactamase superfamily II)